VALTPGNVYTLQIDLISGTTLDEAAGDGNPYAGGQAYFSSGTAFSGSDLVFSEGTNPASAPEPTTLSMLGLAALAMVGLRRFVRRLPVF
jgi:PEP-CTERM motif